MGVGVRPHPRPLYCCQRDPVPIIQKAGWAPAPVWTAADYPQRDSIPGPISPQRVGVPATLSRTPGTCVDIFMLQYNS